MSYGHQWQPTNGTLIRGADGKLYFIPDSALHAYQVGKEGEAAVAPLLDDPGSLPQGVQDPQPLDATHAVVFKPDAAAALMNIRPEKP